MKQQNLKNHARYVPEFHFVMLAILIAVLIMSFIYLIAGVTMISIMFLLIAIASLIGFFKTRSFPLAAQDRAIRAEENLRHFAMTGKLLHKDLTLSQIIALRFADDDEFVQLAERAHKENLSNKQIKEAIKNWRADHHRA